MPKFGRRPWVRRLREKQRRWRSEALLLARQRPEAIVALEVGLDSFWRYRTSEEWQELGWWGRWSRLWRVIGRDVSGGGLLRAMEHEMAGSLQSLSERIVETMWQGTVIADPNVPLNKVYVFRDPLPKVLVSPTMYQRMLLTARSR